MRLSPARFVAFRQSFLDPKRRAIGTGLTHGEVREFVGQGVLPRIPMHRSPWREENHATETRDADGSRGFRGFQRQPRQARKREVIADNVDAKRSRQVDTEFANESVSRPHSNTQDAWNEHAICGVLKAHLDPTLGVDNPLGASHRAVAACGRKKQLQRGLVGGVGALQLPHRRLAIAPIDGNAGAGKRGLQWAQPAEKFHRAVEIESIDGALRLAVRRGRCSTGTDKHATAYRDARANGARSQPERDAAHLSQRSNPSW